MPTMYIKTLTQWKWADRVSVSWLRGGSVNSHWSESIHSVRMCFVPINIRWALGTLRLHLSHSCPTVIDILHFVCYFMDVRIMCGSCGTIHVPLSLCPLPIRPPVSVPLGNTVAHMDNGHVMAHGISILIARIRFLLLCEWKMLR